MPLTRGGENAAATMNGVRFVMLDGITEVACRADSDLLRDLYATSGEGLGDLAAFNKYRCIIEQAASAKYDAGYRVGRGNCCGYKEGYSYPLKPEIWLAAMINKMQGEDLPLFAI